MCLQLSQEEENHYSPTLKLSYPLITIWAAIFENTPLFDTYALLTYLDESIRLLSKDKALQMDLQKSMIWIPLLHTRSSSNHILQHRRMTIKGLHWYYCLLHFNSYHHCDCIVIVLSSCIKTQSESTQQQQHFPQITFSFIFRSSALDPSSTPLTFNAWTFSMKKNNIQ